MASLDLNYRVTCPDCKDVIPNLVEDFASGDLICRNCGCVVGDRIIDTRSEWRNFSNDNGDNNDPSRVGGPSNPLLDGNQLDTVISSEKGTSSKSKDLNKVQSRAAMRGAEKALISGYKDIGSFCDRMNLTRKISDQAKQYFKIADAAKLTKGKNNMAFIAACIYTACRAGGNTRTLKEICASTGNPRPQPEGSFAIRLSFLKYILGVPRREIGRCHKQLVPLIRDQQQLKTISSVDFIARPCSILGIGPELQKIAIEVIQKASQIGCNAGKSPLTIAAAAIYLISLLFPNYAHVQKDISVVIGVSESTFRNAYREMHLHRHEIIPLVSGITTELIESLP